jgi:putative sigma-54 modulation protein
MQLHLSPRNLRLTSAIHAYAAEKIQSIEELGDIIAAHVVLVSDHTAKPKDHFSVKVHLAVPGPDIHAEDKDADLYAALDKVVAKLARQLRKKKTVAIDKKRQVKQRKAEKSKSGR